MYVVRAGSRSMQGYLAPLRPLLVLFIAVLSDMLCTAAQALRNSCSQLALLPQKRCRVPHAFTARSRQLALTLRRSSLQRAMARERAQLCVAAGPAELWARHSASARRAAEQLKGFGLAGVLAYGLLNTLWYTVGFLVAWTTVVQAPCGLGVANTARKLAETFALVWAGSQVTKPLRGAGALCLAPLVKRLQVGVAARLPAGLRSEGAAFTVCVLGCVGIAALLFGTVVLVWA